LMFIFLLWPLNFHLYLSFPCARVHEGLAGDERIGIDMRGLVYVTR